MFSLFKPNHFHFIGKYYLMLFLFIAVVSCNKQSQEKKKKQPNVIFILMDDLGYGQFGIFNDTLTTKDYNPFFVKLVDSLQGYSLDKSLAFSKMAMPTLRALSKNGILFNKAFTSSNICAPSRVGIATGTSQNRRGLYTNIDVARRGIEQGSLLVENLKKLSYNTAHIGKWHIGVHDRSIINKILHKNGFHSPEEFNEVSDTRPDILKEIKESGYSGSVVKEHHPLNNGFDYYYGYNNWASDYYNATNVWENFEHAGKQTEYNTDVFTDKALDFLETQMGNKNPFYLQLHYHAVHDSIEPLAPKKYLDKFKSDSEHLNNFYAHVYGVDQSINRIIEFLKSKQLYENTILVFTSDNGAMSGGSYDGHKTGSPLPGNAPFSGHKGTYYQGGTRVPLLFHWPAGINTIGISESLVSTMDILPSVIDIAGGTVPKNLDGKSLLPIFNQSEIQEVRDNLIWAGIHASKWGYLIAKSTKNHSNEAMFAPPAWAIIEDEYLLRFTGVLEPGIYLDFIDGRLPIFELFDIKNDPAETTNLAERMPEKVQEMAKSYFEGSKAYTAPPYWKHEKWDELKNSKELLRDSL